MITAVSDLTKRFEGTAVGALQGVSFDVPEGCIYTLLGPSGCGKTTTLRSIAGLEEPTSGSIEIDGRVVFDSATGVMVPAEKRKVGMVFQSYAIWPHMNVFENVAFPLKVPGARRPAAEIRRAVQEVLELVELGPYAQRQATQLSGGQQQRLALARALVGEPRLLLLDEPLSNLDAKLRDQMRYELSRLQREQGFTAVYVTHDQVEALSLSHRVAVMKDGRIVQVGTPHEIYARPRSRFIAGFIGRSNFVDGTVGGRVPGGGTGETYEVRTAIGVLHARAYLGSVPSEVAVSVRPEDIRIGTAPPPDAAQNCASGVVDTVLFHGEASDVMVRMGDGTVVQVAVHSSTQVTAGDSVHLSFPVERTVLVPAADDAPAVERTPELAGSPG